MKDAGEMTDGRLRTGSNTPVTPETTLSDLGIDKRTSSRSQKIASIPEEKELAELKAGQRATARALGVTQPTVRRDLGLVETNVSPPEKNTNDSKQIQTAHETYVSPPPSVSGQEAAKVVGRMYERRKKAAHRPKGGQVDHLKTAESIASEVGTNERTVRRYADVYREAEEMGGILLLNHHTEERQDDTFTR